MKRVLILLVAGALVSGIAAYSASVARPAAQQGTPSGR
ncbi:hypothetical protein GGQ96_001284 [Sphingomonas abaci]|uniref:Uncharacterized protein n=1 Tax=Sphingomonas abaci TaxID=237611 RepID=A0A7W7EXL9_9SPHN|nr:hypothetical protein [Sphingomonas abaci]